MIHVWQYAKCSTCRKALRWLDDHGVAYSKVDIVTAPPALEVLRQLWKRSGLPLARFFNTSGESYRSGNFKEKLRTLTDEQALTFLAADGKLLKRPLIDAGATVLVGFDAEAYGPLAKAKAGK